MTALTGSFLVARPVLRDPNFRQSVVFILEHGEGGALGVIVNRPVPAKELPMPVFMGGPCQSPGLIMLHGHAEWNEPADQDEDADGAREVVPGVFVGNATVLAHASELPKSKRDRYRVFWGYSGWGPGQLEQEIASGAWAVLPASAELMFDTPIDSLWTTLRPPAIPEPSLN
jgi:putative transcriptional regulator